MGSEQTFLRVYHCVILVIFAAVFAYAWKTVSKRRNASAVFNPSLLPFAYFSLSSWLLWALQYVILLANSFNYLQSEFIHDTGMYLGFLQNGLWATSLVFLRSKEFPRMSLIVSLLVMCAIVIAVPTYQRTIATPQSLAHIANVSSVTIFLIFAGSIRRQLRVSILFAVVFLIHGYFHGFWLSFWITPRADTQIKHLVFPLWHIALLGAWITLISEMLVTLRVMISSTLKDLAQERDAVDRALRSLNLERFRAETFGSSSETPEALCKSWAEKCHIFILIIGERYGYIIESKGISVVEFEYEVACAQNRQKILIYLKNGVNREPRVEDFLKRLRHFEHGHVMSSFTTPEDLYQRIYHDVPEWLNSQRAKIVKNSSGVTSTFGLS